MPVDENVVDTTAPDESPATASADPDPGLDNFDSFRGVTADTIKVGVAVPDFEALRAAGVQNYWGDVGVAFEAFIDVINEEGGIHGRRIDPVYVGFDFLRNETQDTACAELAEDHEVFIVLGGLLSESNLCLTAVHDTMVMTEAFQTTELRERSNGTVWLSQNAADDAAAEILGSVIAESGRLDGKKIAVVANGFLDEGRAGEVLHETLTGAGYEADVITTSAPASDELARDAEGQRIAQRLLVDGVDFVFLVIGGGGLVEHFATSGFEPEIADAFLESTLTGLDDRSLLDGAITVAPVDDETVWADPAFRAACVDVVLDANPELEDEFVSLPTGEEQAAGEPFWLNPVRNACVQTMLLKELGEIAGAELTNETFKAALDEIGTVELPGIGRASFDSESKWDGNDEFVLQEYNASLDAIESEGEPIIVDR